MLKIHYFFDPMCGWCYGATTLIHELAVMPEFEIMYHPGGMIQKRAIDPSFRQHILQADLQIAHTTQAHFGEAYTARVASTEAFVIDSYLPTKAFLVGADMGIAPHIMLKALQDAHYQEGMHLDTPEGVKSVALSLNLEETLWEAKMLAFETIMIDTIEHSHALMGTLKVSGYPTVFIEKNDQFKPLPHSDYYGKVTKWKDYLRTLI